MKQGREGCEVAVTEAQVIEDVIGEEDLHDEIWADAVALQQFSHEQQLLRGAVPGDAALRRVAYPPTLTDQLANRPAGGHRTSSRLHDAS